MGIDEDGELNIYANLAKSSMMENQAAMVYTDL